MSRLHRLRLHHHAKTAKFFMQSNSAIYILASSSLLSTTREPLLAFTRVHLDGTQVMFPIFRPIRRRRPQRTRGLHRSRGLQLRLKSHFMGSSLPHPSGCATSRQVFRLVLSYS